MVAAASPKAVLHARPTVRTANVQYPPPRRRLRRRLLRRRRRRRRRQLEAGQGVQAGRVEASPMREVVASLMCDSKLLLKVDYRILEEETRPRGDFSWGVI